MSVDAERREEVFLSAKQDPANFRAQVCRMGDDRAQGFCTSAKRLSQSSSLLW